MKDRVMILEIDHSESYGFWTFRVDETLMDTFRNVLSRGAAGLAIDIEYQPNTFDGPERVTCARCQMGLSGSQANRVSTFHWNSRFEVHNGTGAEQIPWLCPHCMEMFYAFMNGKAIGAIVS